MNAKSKVLSVIGCAVLVIAASAGIGARADGNETLGPPATLRVADGTGVLSVTTGSDFGPGALEIEVPARSSVKQVLLYWLGTDPQDSVRKVNGVEVRGVVIGRSPDGQDLNATFRADITDAKLVGSGLNRVEIERAGAAGGPAEAAMIVIVNDGSAPGKIDIRDGRDLASNRIQGGDGDIAIPQTFLLPAADYPRRLDLLLLVSADGGSIPIEILTVAGDAAGSTIHEISQRGEGLESGLVLVPVTVDIPASIAAQQPRNSKKGAGRNSQMKAAPTPVTIQVSLAADDTPPPAGNGPALAGASSPGAGNTFGGGGQVSPNMFPVKTLGSYGIFTISANRSGIGDFVWSDTNCDGVQDAGEPGIAEVHVDLFTCEQVFVGFTETDAVGFYEFRGLAPGCYRVRFTPPSGTVFSPPNASGDDATDSDANPANGVTEATNLSNLEVDFRWDAGVCVAALPASLGDFVWHDLDADGIQEAGEPGIQGETVLLKSCLGSLLDTELTGAAGDYLFSNLTAGCYVVEFLPPAGFVFSAQDQGADDALDSDANTGTGQSGQIVLVAGETNLTVDAGVHQTACLGDFLWNDLNADGIQGAGEPGIAGSTVNLLDCSGGILASTVTDPNGLYLFCGLTPGCYSVGFQAPAGFNFSPQDQGADDAADSDANTTTGQTGPIVLSSGETNLTVDAGVNQPPPPPPGGFRTQTQGGWGTTASGGNPGAYRDAHFAGCFPAGVTIGTAIGPHASFTTSLAIEVFLPAGKTAGVLTTNLVNPITTSAGVLAGQTLSLALSVGFDLCDPAFGSSALNLKDLKVVDATSACYGMTVQQVLDAADDVLSGGGTLSPSTINGCADSINKNYDDGTVDLGYLGLP